MHGKYATDGLVCLSVCVDPADKRNEALKFLKAQNATFPNYLLDATEQVWQNRWEITGPPCVFVFDRNSRRAAKFDNEDSDRPFSSDDVERLVRKLLDEK